MVFQMDFRNDLETLEIGMAIERTDGFSAKAVLRQM